MPRLPRVYIENLLYYVSSKAGHNQTIFNDHQDYQEYISLVSEYKNQYGFKLYSYVLLSSHLHMLIELKNNVLISNIMHDINTRYTKKYNSRYSKKGHLFQSRFVTTYAEKESLLLPLTRHIHLNPKRIGLVVDPKDYLYSSHSQFLSPEKRKYPNLVNEVEEVFGLLKGRETEFENYVVNGYSKEINELKKDVKKKRILGPDNFRESLKNKIEDMVKKQKRQKHLKKYQPFYIALTGVFLFLVASIAVFFYRQRVTAITSEYDTTLALYEKTLDTMRRQSERAIEANKDAEKYMWKIRLAEKALEEVKQERITLEGYSWSIKLRQTGGHRKSFSSFDTIFFENNKIGSINLIAEGFKRSNYSKTRLKNGNISWETIQTNNAGQRANWRGEWDGNIMKGVLRRREASGIVKDFSFQSYNERVKKQTKRGGLK